MSKFDSKEFLKSCSTKPGVYRMFDTHGEVLYVGKARDLKARLTSYFRASGLSIKTRALVSRIQSIETTVTQSEVEALLLEQAQIKALKPPYNILLRDDKSYAFIRLNTQDKWPKASLYRGSRKGKGKYFGPYPSAVAVKETLTLIEKAFLLRNCSDSYFRNRTRPCLQHQIQRCTAPCVGFVSEQDYRQQVETATQFLEGKDQSLAIRLSSEMQAAAEAQDYEKAALLRDRITAVRHIQEHQFVDTGRGNVDVFAVVSAPGMVLIETLFIRQGRLLGHRSWLPSSGADDTESSVLLAFLEQYYLNEPASGIPDEVILPISLEGLEPLEELLEVQGNKVRFAHKVRSERKAWLQLAQKNAKQSLLMRQTEKESVEKRFLALDELLSKNIMPRHIECFDISHTGGEKPVASCVVFAEDGPRKASYRRFNVEPESAGDDYAALEEAVRRRYQRVQKEGAMLPGLLLIDGGKGQVNRIAQVLDELNLTERLPMIGIAKGPSRKAGLEVLCLPNGTELAPAADDPGLHLLQHVRDEAHRFAITGHRARRSKTRGASSLDSIPGVGAKRRKALLHHFGGLAQLKNAPATSIAQVEGISEALAETIYDWLHGQ